jgi:hypothetical protein
VHYPETLPRWLLLSPEFPPIRLCGGPSGYNLHSNICAHTTVSGSGTAYMAALFRLHHFAGTKVAFQERQTDGRNDQNRLFSTTNVEPMGATDDLRPWIKTFMNKVGIQNATELCWRLSTKLMN